ncbi:MAG: 2-hydroxyacid dehydrogenase, partial [Alphaproteobacteria bacterium]
ATAELAFGLVLALDRRLKPAFAAADRGDWARERFTGFQLFGKTLGVLGLGRLGGISVRIGQGFGMRVIAHDVRPVSMAGVEMVDLVTLLSRADVLTIHVHLTPETEGLVDAAALARMKRSAILINTSRGRIVDEAALADALRRGIIAGAGLDVIDGEWLSDEERMRHPLVVHARNHDNLVISPHIGGATVESIYGARVFMARKVADWLLSQPVAAKV